MTVQTKIEEICHQYACQRRWGKDHEASPILHKAQQATKKFSQQRKQSSARKSTTNTYTKSNGQP